MMHKATQHAISLALASTTATATFMMLPTYRSTNANNKLIWANPSLCADLCTIEPDYLAYSAPARWDCSRSLPRPRHGL